MPRKILILFISLFLYVASGDKVYAAGLQLTNIGNLNTTGYQYDEWWYMSQNPTLSGTTEAGATIDITVDGSTQIITADGSGVWTTPITASEGDHTITLTNTGGTYTFTLHISSSIPSDMGAPSAPTQPVAGNFELTLAILSIGLITLFSGIKLAKD